MTPAGASALHRRYGCAGCHCKKDATWRSPAQWLATEPHLQAVKSAPAGDEHHADRCDPRHEAAVVVAPADHAHGRGARCISAGLHCRHNLQQAHQAVSKGGAAVLEPGTFTLMQL